MDTPKLTPMFEQYQSIKAEYPDALLFYRMGDFYELFFKDAEIASRELQIALTSRNKSQGQDVPMCGVPWHASRGYISQLIDKGYVVAICEQIEDPKATKGLVRRKVTQVITPGTVLDENNLEANCHNFLGCIVSQAPNQAFVWADLSTGEWTGAEFSREEDLWQWVAKMTPREILVPEELTLPNQAFLNHVHVVRLHAHLPTLARAQEIICQVQHVPSVDILGLKKKPLLTCACAALIRYFEQTQQCTIDQLKAFQPLNLSRKMLLDDITERNLEIFVGLDGHKGPGTLRAVLDKTVTPMGGRLLEENLHHPHRELQPILDIQAAVGLLAQDDALRLELREILKKGFDLERISQRIALNRCTPKDFIALRSTLSILPSLHDLLSQNEILYTSAHFSQILSNFDALEDLATILDKALVDDPPTIITEGGLFKMGYNQELDNWLDMVEHAEQKLQKLLEEEKERSGLTKLKMGYNRVFGYYYEVSRAKDLKLPSYFVRRQSLANAERFTTEELKNLEEKLLSASDQRKNLEYQLFLALRETIAESRKRLFSVSLVLAHLDYWQSLAEVGRQNSWSFPTFSDQNDLEILGGRHPVIEAMLGQTNFTPNDLSLKSGHNFCLLTGPNMAGKSTILRQTALICLLAQMGSMVPAKKAHLGLVDRLFSRVGASDNLAQGESTFMVEMMETARILRQATKNSLVILDEIGRGTSTYDGVALAWSIVEYMVKKQGGQTRTIFATHYHELTTLEGYLPEVFTMNIAISEYNGSIVFLHKLIPGPSDRSYGVEVARLAGLPAPVVQRAKEILMQLENGRQGMQDCVKKTAQQLLPGIEISDKKVALKASPKPSHPLLSALNSLNPEHLSPMEALSLLMEWKRKWGKSS